MLQRQPVKKLHGDERFAVLVVDFVDGADVGVIEGRRRLRLPLKAGQGLGVFCDVIGEKLQGDKAVEGHVLGLVDHAHAAAAKFFYDVVVRDGPPDHSGQILRG